VNLQNARCKNKDKCTCYLRVHLLVLLHKFKYWLQFFHFTSFPIPYSFTVTYLVFQTHLLIYNRCSSRT